jgi:hypothetical protein
LANPLLNQSTSPEKGNANILAEVTQRRRKGKKTILGYCHAPIQGSFIGVTLHCSQHMMCWQGAEKQHLKQMRGRALLWALRMMLELC